MAKRILVVAHDRPLRETRVALLRQAGYTVEAVAADDHAMAMLDTEQFDLVLLGRKSLLPNQGMDQRLREKHPNLLTLKIESCDVDKSIYPSRITDSKPGHVLAALSEMLGEDLHLIPLTESPRDES